MCRMKSLQFNHVFVVASNRNTIPHLSAAMAHEGEASVREAMVAECYLLYVALMRAEWTAHFSSYVYCPIM